MSLSRSKRGRGCLLGLATGDAVGTAVEFSPRGTFPPVVDMVGGGPFRLEAGEWTDDTSMALCLGTSLVECRGFDPVDQLQRYVRWYREGYLSANGRCFDIGNTVRGALHRFEETGDPNSGPTDAWTAGNGSIMRLAPVVLYYHPDTAAVDEHAGSSSSTTHGAEEAVSACRVLGRILDRLLSGATKTEAVLSMPPAGWMSERIREVAKGRYASKSVEEIKGSGYCVDSLEAALWCFLHTDDFESAILAAANLGDDADTTAAVCGQLAGAHYGEEGIPDRWLSKLAMREDIASLADRLVDHA